MGRKMLLIIAVVTLAAFGLGMEGLGGSGDEKFPEPKLNYKAVVTDDQLVVHNAHHVSVSGDTSLSGYRGAAWLTVDFSRIKKVDIGANSEKAYMTADITLRNGKTVVLKVKKLTRCYGITDIGKMSVRMRDIKSIVFDDELPKEQQ